MLLFGFEIRTRESKFASVSSKLGEALLCTGDSAEGVLPPAGEQQACPLRSRMSGFGADTDSELMLLEFEFVSRFFYVIQIFCLFPWESESQRLT